MREHHRVKVEHDRREVLHDIANQKRKIVSNDYSKHYSTTTLSKRTKNEIIDLVVDLSVVTKERVEFDRIGRIMTMLVTQATKDDKAKFTTAQGIRDCHFLSVKCWCFTYGFRMSFENKLVLRITLFCTCLA